jgi:anti-sigma B factor antagonist
MSKPQFTVDVDGSGSARTVKLRGECDISSAPHLREVLRPLVPPEVTQLTVDVNGLDFIDSTGLGVIVGALRRLREAGGDLTMTGAQGAVRRVLEVTRLDKAIPLV